jgi:hypothetical protein
VEEALLQKVIGLKSRTRSAGGQEVVDKDSAEVHLPVSEFAWRWFVWIGCVLHPL